MPINTLQAIYNQRNIIHNFGAVASGTASSLEIENKVRNLLAAKHKFDPADKQAVGLWNNGEQFKKFTGLFDAIKLFVSVVGLLTLFAGVVGVSNIMLIIVKERTKEIGIRKAIGATPWSIVSQILQEAIVITSLSGYLGLICGVGLLSLMEYAIDSMGASMPYFAQPEVNLGVALGAVLVLVLAGALAGLMPALRAAQIKPIEALRAE
jgi:putative ABC transport system permease protein